jgi:hypothetical protein
MRRGFLMITESVLITSGIGSAYADDVLLAQHYGSGPATVIPRLAPR